MRWNARDARFTRVPSIAAKTQQHSVHSNCPAKAPDLLRFLCETLRVFKVQLSFQKEASSVEKSSCIGEEKQIAEESLAFAYQGNQPRSKRTVS